MTGNPCLNKHTHEVRKKIYTLCTVIYIYIHIVYNNEIHLLWDTSIRSIKFLRQKHFSSFTILRNASLHEIKSSQTKHFRPLDPPSSTYTRKILIHAFIPVQSSPVDGRFDRGEKKERIQARFTAPFQGQRTLLPRLERLLVAFISKVKPVNIDERWRNSSYSRGYNNGANDGGRYQPPAKALPPISLPLTKE